MKGKAQHGSGTLLSLMLNNVIFLGLLGDIIDLETNCTMSKAKMDAIN
jgi:hypothetical protein